MKGVKELRQRLKSVANIQKITKAMEMVATTKLRRLQERAQSTRPFAEKIEGMIRRVSAHVDPSCSPLLLVPDSVESEALIIVAGDRGLCGAYNSNVLRYSLAHLKALETEGVTPKAFVFGKRTQAFATRIRSLDVAHVYPAQVEKIAYRDVRRIVELVSKGFLEGDFQRVRMIYTHMRSMASFVPSTLDLLPVPRQEDDDGAAMDYILEPSPKVIMQRLLPRFLEMQVFAHILDALAAEYAARRMAMKSATDNADEMIGELTMEYNKARQTGITSDLLDIVGGVEALAG
jgi:F-type H+-transporting ATPase subunit gamma